MTSVAPLSIAIARRGDGTTSTPKHARTPTQIDTNAVPDMTTDDVAAVVPVVTPSSIDPSLFSDLTLRSVCDPVPPSDVDFLSVDEWLQRCTAPTQTADTNASTTTVHSSPTTSALAKDHAHMRQVLLLTMVYHSSPFAVLRRVLDELRVPPPPPPPKPEHRPTILDDEDAARSKHSAPLIRSADVVIAKAHPPAAAPGNPILSISPLSPYTPRDSVSPGTSTVSHTASVATTSTAASSVQSLISMYSAASSYASSPPTPHPHAHEPSQSQSVSSQSRSQTHVPPPSRLPPSLPTPAPSRPTPSLSMYFSPSTDLLRPTPYSLWHARKLHIFLMLHEWVYHFPQDFCCHNPTDTTGRDFAPPKRLLEELLYSELGAFPSPEWQTSDNSEHIARPANAADEYLYSQSVHLTSKTLSSFGALARSLLVAYEASRARYRGDDSFGQDTTLAHYQVHTTPSSIDSSFEMVSGTSPSWLSVSPPSTALSTTQQLQRTQPTQSTPWHVTFGGAASVERNLGSEKIRRMMMLAPEVGTSKREQAAAARAAADAMANKFFAEFLSKQPRAYAHALTWLAIQRLEEIGNCRLDDATDAAATTSSGLSFHHPAALPSESFLRLFLAMPSQLTRRQMQISNTMSCFVATTILCTQTVYQRKQVIHHWLEIADECLGRASTKSHVSNAAALQRSTNFMHCFEIIYGINHQSVYRLPAAQLSPSGVLVGDMPKSSFFGSSSSSTVLPLLHRRSFLHTHSYDIYTKLTKLTSPNQNYKEYRKALAESQSTAATARSFYVPYLGILLKDLVGLEEAGKPLAGLLGPEVEASNRGDDDDEDDADAGEADDTVEASRIGIASALRRMSISTSAVSRNNAAADDDDDASAAPMPTGSLPWDDCFLVRPRRNATLTFIPPSGLSGGLPAVSLLTRLADNEDDIFAAVEQAPPTRSRVNTLCQIEGVPTEPLEMKTEEIDVVRPTKSLLSAAVARRASIPSELPPPPQSPVTTMVLADESDEPIPPSVLMLNYAKLSKIHAIVSSTLRCRLQFPSVPLEEEGDDLSDEGRTSRRERPISLAAHRYAKAANTDSSFTAAVAAAALSTPSLRDPALPRVDAPPAVMPAAITVSLPFDRRIQHWLLSSMLTLTIKSESQLMERSYQLFPRKVAAAPRD